MNKIIAYTDGGCRGNGKENSIGGWGVVLEYKGRSKQIYGGTPDTTNNKMELTAVIKALEAVKTTNIPIEIYADSAYVVNGMNQWVKNWIKKDWKKADKKPVENKDLWMKLNELSLKQDNISFLKVKGHDDVELNVLADQLANKGMDEVKIK